MRIKKYIFMLLLLFLFVTGCSTDNTESQYNKQQQAKSNEQKHEKIELTISAAASLEDAFNEIKPVFEEEYPNIKLLFNFGGSGALQKQIIQGAPVDLFFSAAEDKFDELVSKGLIDQNQGNDMLGNTLVLIIPKDSKDSIKGFEDLLHLNDKKFALGTPEAVPAGSYGKQTLEFLGLWKQIQPNLVFAKDVRQVLTYVETGNVAAGIVYKTDALTSDKVLVVSEASADSHDPIVYPVGIVNSNKHMKEAEIFYQYLQEKTAKDTFIKYGFNVLD
ncbi:molybdate ABC transporter substrate-binding protein [Bacillus sp. S/N-304-OC-R1]|uniref:molybdate ABC transporter substrate-binding protein n=1 Tax=Bacillus sp. S/N-304-OC-R1 TaxID=2758034 RepID=UPI001C8EAC2E|nr:molybdate ABC transporter substrate-binding protein [Bacillus sp. S/N-304-OC-R1]MBY0120388.1 molybdate ABC transporter substrate-binding protein [Bacillus sp. S/N-304-OC-R1]